MNINKLKERYETAKKSHDNFVKSSVSNESAYQDSCNKVRSAYEDYYKASKDTDSPSLSGSKHHLSWQRHRILD